MLTLTIHMYMVLSLRVKIVLTYFTEKLLVLELSFKPTLEKQYFIVSEPKGEVISSKIDRVLAI
jgi:hypothetical protein